jgi:hypothetical protein
MRKNNLNLHCIYWFTQDNCLINLWSEKVSRDSLIIRSKNWRNRLRDPNLRLWHACSLLTSWIIKNNDSERYFVLSHNNDRIACIKIEWNQNQWSLLQKGWAWEKWRTERNRSQSSCLCWKTYSSSLELCKTLQRPRCLPFANVLP